MLRLWHSSVQRPDFQAWMLADMAEYLALEANAEGALRLLREACQVAEGWWNLYELRQRQHDLAKMEVQVGNAEAALSLATLSAQYPPFWHASMKMLFAEGLVALEDRNGAQVWFERARAYMQKYECPMPHRHLSSSRAMRQTLAVGANCC